MDECMSIWIWKARYIYIYITGRMDPSQQRLWRKALMISGGIMLTGILLFKYTTPTEEELVAKLSPELRADYERNKELRRKEQQVLMEIVKQTASSKDPIWKTGSIKSPWDRDNVQSAESILVKKERFERGVAADEQKEQLKQLQKQIEMTESLEKKQETGKKGWSLKFW